MPPMSKELWAEVKPLLDEALDLDPDARTAWLERLRQRSPRLAQEVRALLDTPADDLELFSPAESSGLLGQSLAGQIVGGYTLDRLIGRGGMGAVWLAHRSDGRFEGEAAVKLLNLALVGHAGEQRFRNEGTVLARLTHPNIARLYDAGVTAGGQPFLTLEYIRGDPIDRWADDRKLPPDARVHLMIDVLTALGSAHANLIVHRDIKPSNILVTDEGRVKLLDFGIARMLEEGRSTQAALTDPATLILTPEYGAPELVTGDPVSTATDVYSSGVLLHVLLSGCHPTSRDGDTPASALTAVVEREPVRLSEAVLAGSADAREARAAQRGMTAASLARACRGDLEHIVAKALHKSPAGRYPTANAFADDLGRYLRHEPVTAMAESVAYRARKFVRRYRAAVLSSAVALLALVGGAGFAVSQMVVARRERDRAEDSRKRTEASVGFESLMFRLMAPGGPAMTYEELLAKGRLALEKEYRGEPVSRLQLRINFAQHYLRGNDPEAAREIIDGAVRLADSLGDAEWRARTQCELAAVHAVMRQGDSALALVAAARRLLSSVRHLRSATREACDYAEGNARFAANQRDSAAAIFRAMVARLEQAGDTVGSDYLETLNNLARALYGSGRMREAREIFFRIIRASRGGATADPRSINVFLYNITLLFDALGEYRDARRYLGPQLAMSFATDSVSVDAMNVFDYAKLLSQLGETDSAAYWFARAIENPARIDSARRLRAHLELARLSEGLGRIGPARAHRAEADRLEPAAARSIPARAELAADRIRAVGQAEDGDAVRATIRSELEAMDYAPDSRSERITVLLGEAASALIATGRYADAAPYAEHLERIGTRDSLSVRQSGVVGRARLLQARIAIGLGDTVRARDLVASSLAPLEFGYGALHALTRQATALRDSLGSGSTVR